MSGGPRIKDDSLVLISGGRTYLLTGVRVVTMDHSIEHEPISVLGERGSVVEHMPGREIMKITLEGRVSIVGTEGTDGVPKPREDSHTITIPVPDIKKTKIELHRTRADGSTVKVGEIGEHELDKLRTPVTTPKRTPKFTWEPGAEPKRAETLKLPVGHEVPLLDPDTGEELDRATWDGKMPPSSEDEAPFVDPFSDLDKALKAPLARGSELKVESLEAVMKVVTFDDTRIKFDGSKLAKTLDKTIKDKDKV